MSPPTVLSKNHVGYDWVLLNSRWYIVQNYSPDKLADGTPIPVVTDNATWTELTTPARCDYNNSTDAEFIAKHGYLYNWYGVGDGLEMPCADCVVPSSDEWTELTNWMIASGFNWDGTTEDNKIGKAIASDGGEWNASATVGDVGNDQESNNSSGLTMFPSGRRRRNTGAFQDLGAVHRGWTSTSESGEATEYVLTAILQELRFFEFDLQAGRSIRISRPYIKKRFRGLAFGTIKQIGF